MQLAAVQGDGATLRVHLQRLAASTGRVDPLLNEPPLPVPVQALWRDFLALCGARTSGMAPQPLTLHDIAAWCGLTGTRYTHWELDTLLHTDSAMRAAWSALQPKHGH